MAIFEHSVRTADIPAGGTYNLVFTTTSPVIFLNRNIAFTGLLGSADVYEAPTGVSAGTLPVPFPLDLYQGAVSVSTIRQAATITGVGTKRAATTLYRGSSGQGQTVIGTYVSSSTERRLKGNTVYLLQFINNDASALPLDIYLRWHEGGEATLGG